jgi:hypothetical protein
MEARAERRRHSATHSQRHGPAQHLASPRAPTAHLSLRARKPPAAGAPRPVVRSSATAPAAMSQGESMVNVTLEVDSAERLCVVERADASSYSELLDTAMATSGVQLQPGVKPQVRCRPMARLAARSAAPRGRSAPAPTACSVRACSWTLYHFGQPPLRSPRCSSRLRRSGWRWRTRTAAGSSWRRRRSRRPCPRSSSCCSQRRRRRLARRRSGGSSSRGARAAAVLQLQAPRRQRQQAAAAGRAGCSGRQCWPSRGCWPLSCWSSQVGACQAGEAAWHGADRGRCCTTRRPRI